jgi:hypothetical protein
VTKTNTERKFHTFSFIKELCDTVLTEPGTYPKVGRVRSVHVTNHDAAPTETGDKGSHKKLNKAFAVLCSTAVHLQCYVLLILSFLTLRQTAGTVCRLSVNSPHDFNIV